MPFRKEIDRLVAFRELPEAETKLRAYLGEHPSDSWAMNKLGAVLALSGRHEEAAAVLDSLLAEDEKYAPAWINRGNIAFEKGDLDGAQACYEKALQLDPDAATAHHNLAAVQKKRGDISAMVRHLKDARKAERRRRD